MKSFPQRVNKDAKRLVWMLPYGLVFALMVSIPAYSSSYITGLMLITLMYAFGSMSFNLLLGYSGLLSFGHAYAWGLGSYTVGMLVGKGITDNFWLVLGIAIFVTGLVSAFFGFLALRTHGVYFSFITLSFSELLRSSVMKWTKVTGGENGLTGIRRPFALDETSYYYLVLVGFVVCFFIMKWLIASWFGKILNGIRENESRILMLGYNTWVYKYFAFIFAGIFAAIGGLLSAYYYGIAAPDHFSLLVTGNFLLGTLIGGKRTLFGPVLGTAVVVGSNNYISTYTEHWLLIEGAMFILVVTFFKKGIFGYIQEWWKR